jgi:hypothetical protein
MPLREARCKRKVFASAGAGSRASTLPQRSTAMSFWEAACRRKVFASAKAGSHASTLPQRSTAMSFWELLAGERFSPLQRLARVQAASHRDQQRCPFGSCLLAKGLRLCRGWLACKHPPTKINSDVLLGGCLQAKGFRLCKGWLACKHPPTKINSDALLGDACRRKVFASAEAGSRASTLPQRSTAMSFWEMLAGERFSPLQRLVRVQAPSHKDQQRCPFGRCLPTKDFRLCRGWFACKHPPTEINSDALLGAACRRRVFDFAETSSLASTFPQKPIAPTLRGNV